MCIYMYIYIDTHIWIYVHIYICMCISVVRDLPASRPERSGRVAVPEQRPRFLRGDLPSADVMGADRIL